jgi:ubiquitin-protein ligase
VSLRLKRLKVEHDRLTNAYQGHQRIRVRPEAADPPERYEVDYAVKGLELMPSGELVSRTTHTIEIVLPAEYPRRPPVCKMMTPVFHPNIDTWTICTSDHWAAQETLVDLVVRIGQILTYQSYNTKSPLNAQAARWCDENQARLPVDKADLHPMQHGDDAPPPPPVPPQEALAAALEASAEKIKGLVNAGSVADALGMLAAAEGLLSTQIQPAAEDAKLAELLEKRQRVLTAVAVLRDNCAKLGAWSKGLEAQARSAQSAAPLKEATAHAVSVLRRTAMLPAPEWMGGALTQETIRTLKDEAAGVTAKLRTLIADFQRAMQGTAQPLAKKSIHAVMHPLYDRLAQAAPREGLDALAAGLGEDAQADLAAAQKQFVALVAVMPWLQFVAGAVNAKVMHGPTQGMIKEFEGALSARLDSVRVVMQDQRVLLEAGNQYQARPAVPGSVATGSAPPGSAGVMIGCRIVASTGNVAITDGAGRQLFEYERVKSVPLKGSGTEPAITILFSTPTSKEILAAAAQLMAPFEALFENPKPTPGPDVEVPGWFASWQDPLEPGVPQETLEKLRTIKAAANRRIWSGRIRTSLLEMRCLIAEGQGLMQAIAREQGPIDAVKARVAAIAAYGHLEDDQTLVLPEALLPEYQALEQKLALMRDRRQGLRVPVNRVCEGLRTSLRGLQEKLREAPKEAVYTDLATELKTVTGQVNLALQNWDPNKAAK